MMSDMTRSGTATFLAAGVERSEPLWEMAPDAAAAAIERHDDLVAAAIRSHGGTETGSAESGGDGRANGHVRAALVASSS